MYFDSESSSTDLRFFTWLVVAAQVLGMLAVVLVGVWMGHFQGGFAWQSNPALQFNYHPLFMVIGMVFLYADGILVYRVFRNDKKIYIKVLHGVIHSLALVFGGVGLKAVFDSHDLAKPKPIPNLYSLHSWTGLFTVVAFGLQWLMGFAAFLTPVAGVALKRFYMPFHRFWGTLLLGLAGATALMGIAENTIFKKVPQFGAERIVTNFLGLLIIAFVVLVIYLVTKPDYRRLPSPEEDHIQLAE